MRVFLCILIVFVSLNARKNYVGVGGAYIDKKDNFYAKDEKFNPYLNFYFQHSIGEKTKFHIGSKQEKPSIGINTITKFGLFELSVLPITGKEYKNPFATNAHKYTTTTKSVAASLGWGIRISDVGALLIYTHQRKWYDNDETPKTLQRSAQKHILALQTSFKVDDLRISPGIFYAQSNAKGEASSFTSSGLSVRLMKVFAKNTTMSFIFATSLKKFHAQNEILSKKIQTQKYATYVFLRHLNLFNVEKMFVELGLGTGHTRANHEFYDADTNFVILSIGTEF